MSSPPGGRKQRTARVPEGRGERIARLAGLLAGAGERGSSVFLPRAGALRLADTLADLRGAAMKLGQLLSLQGDDLLSPGLRETLASLQNHAHFMPEAQVRQ